MELVISNWCPDDFRRLGRILSGRYRLDGIVGSGGMATVFRGTDLLLDRAVAVKLLPEALGSDRGALERFEREARVAASVSAHPNVVSIFDFGTDRGIPYLVMELIEGPNLGDFMRQTGIIEPRRSLSIAREIGSGLHFAHQHGFLHRDVKPQNVLIGPAGVAKIADFGIAQPDGWSDLTETGTVLGTAAYLAPERIRGAPASHASDVYSLGIILFEMLTASLPFSQRLDLEPVHGDLRADPPQPSLFNSAVPAWLDSLVVEMLASEPQARPSLSRVLEVLGDQSGGPQAPTVPPNRARRSLLAPALAATLLLALIGGGTSAALHGPFFSQAGTHHVLAPPKRAASSRPPDARRQHPTGAHPSAPTPSFTYLWIDRPELVPGGTTTLRYTCTNPSSHPVLAQLRARIIDPATGGNYWDATHAPRVQLLPGTHTYARVFKLSSTVPPGLYDVLARITGSATHAVWGTIRLNGVVTVSPAAVGTVSQVRPARDEVTGRRGRERSTSNARLRLPARPAPRHGPAKQPADPRQHSRPGPHGPDGRPPSRRPARGAGSSGPGSKQPSHGPTRTRPVPPKRARLG